MRFHAVSLGLGAALALAGCSDVRTRSGPPIAGAAAGPGSSPLVQESRDNMGAGSGNASAGQATITGARGSSAGGPIIERQGTGAGPGVGASPYSSTTQPLRVPGLGQRGGGGG